MDTHSADAIVQIAVQMEQLGQDFYEALAGVTTDPDLASICQSLALAESRHREYFSQVRGELAAQGRTALLDDAVVAEARGVLKEVVVPDRGQMLQALSAGRVVDLVDCAAKMERNSISYYRGLGEHLSEKEVVLTILEEELDHLRSLERLGTKLRSEGGSTP
jgi:rubrerythrin